MGPCQLQSTELVAERTERRMRPNTFMVMFDSRCRFNLMLGMFCEIGRLFSFLKRFVPGHDLRLRTHQDLCLRTHQDLCLQAKVHFVWNVLIDETSFFLFCGILCETTTFTCGRIAHDNLRTGTHLSFFWSEDLQQPKMRCKSCFLITGSFERNGARCARTHGVLIAVS